MRDLGLTYLGLGEAWDDFRCESSIRWNHGLVGERDAQRFNLENVGRRGNGGRAEKSGVRALNLINWKSIQEGLTREYLKEQNSGFSRGTKKKTHKARTFVRTWDYKS